MSRKPMNAKTVSARATAEPATPASASTALRAAKDELVRQHLLRAAETVFAEFGFTQTKMQAIAREAGVSLATLYQSHPSKQDLYRAVLLMHDRNMMAQVLSHPRMRGGVALSIVPLLELMSAHLSYLLSHPDYLRMILHEGYAWYHSAAQPTADEQALWQQGLHLMSAVFTHGMETGELVPANPAEQARLLMALQQARLASWVAAGMQEPHGEVIRQIQADFVRQFCRPAIARQLLSEDGSRLDVALASQT